MNTIEREQVSPMQAARLTCARLSHLRAEVLDTHNPFIIDKVREDITHYEQRLDHFAKQSRGAFKVLEGGRK